MLANLMRYLVPNGVNFPAPSSLESKDEYKEIVTRLAELVSYINNMTISIHQRLKDTPGKDQVAEIENAVNEIKDRYKEAKAHVAELEHEGKKLTGILVD